jgi:hypothetical protein
MEERPRRQKKSSRHEIDQHLHHTSSCICAHISAPRSGCFRAARSAHAQANHLIMTGHWRCQGAVAQLGRDRVPWKEQLAFNQKVRGPKAMPEIPAAPNRCACACVSGKHYLRRQLASDMYGLKGPSRLPSELRKNDSIDGLSAS